MLSVPIPLVFPNFSDLMLPHQLRQGLVWSIAVIAFMVLPVFALFDECRDGTVGFTCHRDHMYRDRQGILVPLASKTCQCIDEVRLPGFLEWSSFDPVFLVFAVFRSAEGD